MRLLVTIAHYFKQTANAHSRPVSGSSTLPFAKIAALNAQIIALHRYFGPFRLSLNPDDPRRRWGAGDNALDIVIMTVRDTNLLPWIGVDPTTYAIEYFDGAPQMVPFEAQRIMRERTGGYDFYAYLEDDLIVDDPEFFAKIGWFASEFGPRAMLMPVRFEMAHTGMPAKVAVGLRLSHETNAPFCRPDIPNTLVGSWHGKEQTFCRPNNPHSGCFVITDSQLRLWTAHPSFYDRDSSWIDTLASAATYAPGKVFGLYQAVSPDPWFLEIEHYGTRLASRIAASGQLLGEPPLLAMVEAAASDGNASIPKALAAIASPPGTINAIASEAAELRYRLGALEASRTRLAKALLRALWRKAPGRR
jgi:hypothetical protein